jgi:hypothetical protein
MHVFVSEGDISDEPEERVTDMSQLYQIFADEVLGSGQFGTVYGGGEGLYLVTTYYLKF